MKIEMSSAGKTSAFFSAELILREWKTALRRFFFIKKKQQSYGARD